MPIIHAVEVPEHDSELAVQVATLLKSSTMRIHFTYAGALISHGGYCEVAEQILAGHILVGLDSSRGLAAYNPYVDTFYLVSSDLFEPRVKASVVHEATHALCDLHGVGMTTIDAEIIGYVAQAMWLRLNGPDYLAGQAPQGKSPVDKLRRAAFAIGDVLLAGTPNAWSKENLAALKRAIGPLYPGISKGPKADTAFDGLGNTWRLGPQEAGKP